MISVSYVFLIHVWMHILASDDVLIPEEMFSMCDMQFVTRKWHTNSHSISKVANVETRGTTDKNQPSG